MSNINYIFNNHVVVLTQGANVTQILASEKPELFQQAVLLCMQDKPEEALDLVVDDSAERFVEEKLGAVTDGMLSYDEASGKVVFTASDKRVFPVDMTFAVRVRDAVRNRDTRALDIYKQFMVKAANNPNVESASDLFEFISVNKLPMTEDGELLAYKIVREDFLDIHSKTKDHTPGSVVTEDNVDYDRHRTCSNGLHFCSKDYLPQYGGSFGSGDNGNRLVLVKIHPEDVAAFPRDYHNAKGRCRKYTVVAELPVAFFSAIVTAMESVPFVNLAELGLTSGLRKRLGDRVPSAPVVKSTKSYVDLTGEGDELQEEQDDEDGFSFGTSYGSAEDREDLDFDVSDLEDEIRPKLVVDSTTLQQLETQVRNHNNSVHRATVGITQIVNGVIVADGNSRWYVGIQGENQPRKLIAVAKSRGEARELKAEYESEIARDQMNDTYMGIVKPKLFIYDIENS